MRPKALIPLATGTNRDRDVAQALELTGAEPFIVPLQHLRQSSQDWQEYQMLVLAGGFSYADALGAGRLLALDLRHFFAEQVTRFVEAGKPVIGICNGFQALVSAGILPDASHAHEDQGTALSFNACGHFECRWVKLLPLSQRCIWTRDLQEPIECPVAHGEGNFVVSDPGIAENLKQMDQIALIYLNRQGKPALSQYSDNPNGSIMDIAGICNPQGNVLGLMPHPENHIFTYQYPGWTRHRGYLGLPLFENGVMFAREF